jgi:hypothetical protein
MIEEKQKFNFYTFFFLFYFLINLSSLHAMDNPIDKVIQGHFYNNFSEWKTPPGSWNPVPFNKFEGNDVLLGNIRPGNIEEITIPEDGIYSLSANYCWRAINENVISSGNNAAPQSSIVLQRANNNHNHTHVQVVRNHPQLLVNTEDYGSLNHTCSFKIGDKISLRTYFGGNTNIQYNPSRFQLYIEKIN